MSLAMAPFNSKQLPRMQLGRGEAADIKPSFGPRQASSFFRQLEKLYCTGRHAIDWLQVFVERRPGLSFLAS